MGVKVSKELLDTSLTVAMQASPKATIDCVTAFGETDFRADMAAFTIPTLIIHGVDDKTVPIDISAREAAKLVPHATLKEYDGEAHGLHVTAKDKLNEDLVAFLGS
jgi:pimeloyl-ACP methyl ester carboxylesterase